MPWRPKRRPIPWRTVAKVLLPIVALVVAIELVAHVVEQRRPPQRARTLRERAQLHRQLGQLDEAARALEEAVELLPDDVQATLMLAQVRQAQGRLEQAERVLRGALERRPRDPVLVVPLARLLLDTGRPLEAAEVLEPELGAIRKVTDPLERIDALLVAGRAAAGRGALLEAEALFREATRVGPAPVTTVAKAAAEACLALTDLLTRSGRLPAALDALEAARSLTPWDPRIALARARVLELGGQTQEALAQLRPLVEAPDGPDLVAAASMADVLLRARHLDAVAELASRVQAAPAGQELAGAMRAAAALGSGDLARAQAEAARFLESHPTSPAAQLAQGRAALAAGSADLARRSFDAALAAAPALTEAALGALEVERRAGDVPAIRSRASALLERADARAWGLRALVGLAARDPGALAHGRERLEALAAARPSDTRLRVHLGLLRLATGDVARAADDLEPLLSAPDLATASSTLGDSPEAMLQATAAVEGLGVLLLGHEDPMARLLIARALERLDRPWLALALLGEPDGPELDVDRAALHVRLGLRTGDPRRAVAALEALRARAPDDAAVLAALGETQLASGDVAAARVTLEQAARALPDNAAVWARLGRARVGAGDLAGGEQAYARARALRPALVIAHEDAALPLASGDADAATRRLRAALEATGDGRFALALAAAEAAAGRPRAGLEVLARGGRSGAHPLVAALLAEAGDLERARAMARTVGVPEVVQRAAGEAAPRRALWALVALSTLEWGAPAGRQAEAILADERADALSLWWAWNATEARDAATAVKLGERLVRLAPDDARLALRLAAAHRAAGDAAGDAAVVRRVQAWTIEDPATLTELGMALERIGEPALAEARYRQALARAGDPVAHNDLACLLAAGTDERRREALQHAREALRLAPNAAEILDTLGWVQHLLGQDHEALELLERAAARLPANPTVRFHLAEVLHALNRADDARLALEVALRLPPGWPEEAQARARLETLGAAGR